MANPYKLRLDLLSMAKELLMEDYHTKIHAIEQSYKRQVDLISRSQGYTEIEYPTLPPMPSAEDITSLAIKFNKFISNGNV